MANLNEEKMSWSMKCLSKNFGGVNEVSLSAARVSRSFSLHTPKNCGNPHVLLRNKPLKWRTLEWAFKVPANRYETASKSLLIVFKLHGIIQHCESKEKSNPVRDASPWALIPQAAA